MTAEQPPRWAEALLRMLLRPEDRESITGDLLEEYREVRRPARGRFRANLWYTRHVISFLTPLTWPFAAALAALSLAAFLTFFTAAAADPDLLVAPFRQPFILVILASYLLIVLSYSAFIGFVAGAAGKWFGPPAVPGLRASN